jgi:hypothetical protein
VRRHRALAPMLMLAASAWGGPAGAQEANAEPYSPLFPPETIRRATPEQRERMRAAEEQNRQAYERRKQAGQQPQAPSQEASPQAAPSSPLPQRKKVYKWVDDKGRTHFGDAPPAEGAEEVIIRGVGSRRPSPPAGESRDATLPPSPTGSAGGAPARRPGGS